MSRVLSVFNLRETPDVPGRISDVAELCSPCRDLLERLGIESIIAVAAGAACGDQSAMPQDGQVL